MVALVTPELITTSHVPPICNVAEQNAPPHFIAIARRGAHRANAFSGNKVICNNHLSLTGPAGWLVRLFFLTGCTILPGQIIKSESSFNRFYKFFISSKCFILSFILSIICWQFNLGIFLLKRGVTLRTLLFISKL
jgi:hypothetical protein